MKRILFILIITAPAFVFAQSSSGNIKGVVTYFFNNAQGDKPDVGAKVYVIDSLKMDTLLAKTIRNLSLAKTLRQSDQILGVKSPPSKYEKIAAKDPQLGKLIIDDDYFKLTNDSALAAYNKIYYRYLSTTVDGAGNYSIQVAPGTYYVFISSNGRSSIGNFDGIDMRKVHAVSGTDARDDHKFYMD